MLAGVHGLAPPRLDTTRVRQQHSPFGPTFWFCSRVLTMSKGKAPHVPSMPATAPTTSFAGRGILTGGGVPAPSPAAGLPAHTPANLGPARGRRPGTTCRRLGMVSIWIRCRGRSGTRGQSRRPLSCLGRSSRSARLLRTRMASTVSKQAGHRAAQALKPSGKVPGGRLYRVVYRNEVRVHVQVRVRAAEPGSRGDSGRSRLAKFCSSAAAVGSAPTDRLLLPPRAGRRAEPWRLHVLRPSSAGSAHLRLPG